MTESVFDQIVLSAKALKIDLSSEEIAALVQKENMSEQSITDISTVFRYLEQKHKDAVIEGCLTFSRLPRKDPKTFDNFDFSRIHGKDVEALKNIPTLSALYARKNMAFIGPQGVGKTHLAMAFGRAVCEMGMKSYFLKATELNQKLTNARKFDKVASVTTGLVKPSCLIIDEIGRCVFDEVNTQIFFDIIDRRSNKEGPNCMIFTSNKNSSTWGKHFIEQDSLLCALDRFFDDSTVFVIKGESYRGRKTETISLEAGTNKSLK